MTDLQSSWQMADSFLSMLAPERKRWKFRAQRTRGTREDGRAVEIVGTLDQVFEELAELNRQGYEIFVGSEKPLLIDDYSNGELLPADYDALAFLATVSDGEGNEASTAEDWFECPMPHIQMAIGTNCVQSLWRVTGLSASRAATIMQEVSRCAGGSKEAEAGFANLLGFQTPLGEKYGDPFEPKIIATSEAEPIHGPKAWFAHNRIVHGDYLVERAQAEARAAREKLERVEGGTFTDDDTVLNALRAAAEIGQRIPARIGATASAWHALRAIPELGKELAHRRCRDRVHAVLVRLQRDGKILRVPGRTAGRREAEFFEIAP